MSPSILQQRSLPRPSPRGARWQHQTRFKVLPPAGLAVPPNPERLLHVTFALGCAITPP